MPQRTDDSLLWPLIAVTLAAVALIARMTGPSDLWDQMQPRTIAYTADMVSRGGEAWILARDVDGLAATKPPLYNWLAAPFVALVGRHSELAHRAPSMLAMLAVAALLVVVGRRIAPTVGWIAASAWIASYPTFKLGYLARPDLLLCLVLLVGWIAITRVLLATPESRSRRSGWIALAWIALIAASWTKGPAAVVLPLYAIAGSWALSRSLRPLAAFRPLSLGPIAIVAATGWYIAVWFMEPAHLVDTLWRTEILDRVQGAPGTTGGPTAILKGLPVMSLYFLGNFVPWSIATVVGALDLLRRQGERRRWRSLQEGPLLLLAVIWTAVVIAAFSLSAGKRADYIAPAFPTAALVAGWWIATVPLAELARRGRAAVLGPAAVGLVGLAILAAHTVVQRRGTTLPAAASLRFGEVAERLGHESGEAAVVVLTAACPHLTVLRATPPPGANTAATLQRLLGSGQELLVLVGHGDTDPLLEFGDVDASLAASERWSLELTPEAVAIGYPPRLSLLAVHAITVEEDVIAGSAARPRSR
jgi:4-amino-4-deoxy-L-arabinose transferase-like glycosyltransferase